MAEWEKVKVGDIGKVITGKTPKTYNSEYYGGNIPFLTPSDDMSVKYVRRTNKYLPPHQCVAQIAATQRRQMPKPDGCLHTNGEVSGGGGNEKTPQVFSSLRAA